MYALLLDSSDKNLSVGLAKEHEVVDRIEYEAWQRQSEHMILEIDNILKRNSLTRKDISEVVVSKGPGSYTGVRIALAIAKTISFALDIPLYLVSSLSVLQTRGERSLCLMNARSKRSYVGIYEGEKCINEDTVWTNDEVHAFIKNHPGCLPCGDIAYLGLEGGAVDVLKNLALSDTEQNRSIDPLGAKPVYLKDTYAAIKLREATKEDAPKIASLEALAFDDPWPESQIKYELEENPVSHLYVFEEDDKIIGYVDFWITFDSSTVARIAVDPSRRKRGYADKLIAKMIEVLNVQDEAVLWCTLEVRKGNEPAIRLYKKHGFETVTEKKGYYSDGEDALYMMRKM